MSEDKPLDRQGFQIDDRVQTSTGTTRVWIVKDFRAGEGNLGGTNAVLVQEGRPPSIYTTITVLTTRLRKAGDQ